MSSETGLVATADDLPPSVAEALASPPEGEEAAVDADGRRWHFLAWGHSTDPPLLLTHGVGSSARGWWRVGPALAAAGRRAVAVDMPGHGQTAACDGRHRFIQTAADLAGSNPVLLVRHGRDDGRCCPARQGSRFVIEGGSRRGGG